MSLTKKVFGTDKKSGRAVYEYRIENKNGMCAKILNYGGIIREHWVPGQNGETAGVGLGHYKLGAFF